MSEGSPERPERERDEPALEAKDEASALSPDHPDRGPGEEELDEEARAVLDEAGGSGLDEVDVRELLRSALAPPRGAVAPELLRGVQRKIRTRSRGKFYGDGWSTARSPRSTYLITSLLMLLLMALVYFTLIPWGGGALP
jgi:hypothetical protein